MIKRKIYYFSKYMKISVRIWFLFVLIGNWVENGQYPNDEKALKQIVEGISYYNAKRYFSL